MTVRTPKKPNHGVEFFPIVCSAGIPGQPRKPGRRPTDERDCRLVLLRRLHPKVAAEVARELGPLDLATATNAAKDAEIELFEKKLNIPDIRIAPEMMTQDLLLIAARSTRARARRKSARNPA